MDIRTLFEEVDQIILNRRVARIIDGLRELQPLEEKVEEWTKEKPAVWNVGIGPAASFMPTLARILLERTKEIYGPHDYVIHVRLSPAAECSDSLVALEILMGMAKMLLPGDDDELQELKQLVAEESYYAYGTASSDLMLKAFGADFSDLYGWSIKKVLEDPNIERSKYFDPIRKRIAKALKGKRCLLVIENLRAPISLDIVALIMSRRPAIFNNRWLVSATSMDVYNRSRQQVYTPKFGQYRHSFFHISSDNYSVLPFDDLRQNEDWALLIMEALKDAARSIHNALKVIDEMFWLCVAQQCLYYCILYHPLEGGAATTSSPCISSDELVRCWVSEQLLYKIRGPSKSAVTDITSMRQSNYGSAYEDGKVVIKALQEYSLLPIYTPTGTSSGSRDAITGLSKLAKDVPQLKKDDLSQPPNIHRRTIWVSFLNDDGRVVSLDFQDNSPPRKMNMTTLILRGWSGILDFPFHEMFTPILRVLDLSYTLINSLPSWFSLLPNLVLLSLRGCSKLYKLSPPPPHTSQEETPPLAHLGSLQALDMNGVPLSELTNQDGSNKGSLHYLDLSGSRVTTLPSEFFSEMSSLEELILANCSNLNELPSSLVKLSNLLILCVEGTQITTFPDDTFEEMQRLHTLKLINNKRLISLPLSLSKARGLKELHICNCTRIKLQYLLELVSCLESLYIQTWQGLESIKIRGHPNLKTFSLCGPWIRCLSLHGCKKLKTVNFSDTTALEAVDLSGTAIEEVPHNLPNLPQLRMLLLLNVPCFKRFPWHQLVRFPKVFCLSHFEDDNTQFSSMFVQQEICADENQHTEKTMNTAQININDSRMFHSFNADATNKLVKGGQFLQSFSVQVKPCSARGKEPRNKEVELCTNIQRLSPYSDVRYSEAASIMPMLKLQPRQRHVEISAIMDRYPRGLRQLLSVTHSIFITDDASVRCLTDLNFSLMSLEECQLQHCRQMKIVLRMKSEGSEAALSSLKILQVCNLENLLSFVEPSVLSVSRLITLKLLKHIHIENCPRLQKIFPCSLSLPSLESLVILFCTDLNTIFYKERAYEVAPSPLPNIERIYLQELPQLQHIHDDVMFAFETPKWESLFVRGCRSFQRLPLLKKEYLKSKVKVSGERDWWDKMQLSLPEQSDYYFQVPQPEFASRKKGVVIKSYLR